MTTNDEQSDPDAPTPGPDEVFCTECGEVIKERAEVCPECGVRQEPAETDAEPATQQQDGATGTLTERRRYELEKIAGADKTTTLLLGFFLTPLGYWMIGKTTLAIVNFLTLNYLFMGPIIVPIHCHKIIEDAKDELRMAGVSGY